MADKKISQLDASTTPLGGTEELAVVQSSNTKKVSVANLTAGRSVGVADLSLTSTTNGVLNLNGYRSSLGGTTTDAYIFKTGNTGSTPFDQTGGVVYQARENAVEGRSNHYFYTGSPLTMRMNIQANGDVNVKTGNLVIGTSGKGIDFSATAGTGTSELLDDYEEGTWTPTVTQGSVTDIDGARYVKVGNLVTIWAALGPFTNTTSADPIVISGIPFANGSQRVVGSLHCRYLSTSSVHLAPTISGSSSNIYVSELNSGADWGTATYSDFNSASNRMTISLTYSVG